VFRALARAIQRQALWGAAATGACFLFAAASLPWTLPLAASGWIPLRDGVWSPSKAQAFLHGSECLQEAAKILRGPGLNPALLEREASRIGAELSSRLQPLPPTIEVTHPSEDALRAILAAFPRASAAARSSELRAETERIDLESLERRKALSSLPPGPQRLLESELALRAEEAELAALDGRIERLSGRLERQDPGQPAQRIDSTESDRIGTELSAARDALLELRRRYPEDWPPVTEAADRVERLRARQALALNREILGARFAPVRSLIDEARALAARRLALQDSIAAKRAETDRLRSGGPPPDSEPRRASLEASLAGLEARRERASEALRAPAVAESPLPPQRARRPGWTLPLLFLASLSVGIGVCLGRESLCGTLRTQHDVRRIVNLPLLGIVPLTPSPFALRGSPPAALLEAFRSAALLIEARLKAESAKLLAVTSPGPSEGKSTVAADLAVFLARAGLRVLLVDGDLRRPSQHRLFGCPPDLGLTSYLSGGVESLDPALVATEVENLVLLPAGPAPEDPLAYFRSERFQGLARDLRGWYDLTIIDLPPVAAAAEALSVAASADGVLLALAAGATGKDAITDAKRRLRALQAKLWGCILTKATIRSRGYYDYSPPVQTGEAA
jgi:capsular exopolysaccharide synthesis family protein